MAWKHESGLSVSSAIKLDKTRDPERGRRVYWAGIKHNKLNQSVKIFTTFCLFFTKMVVAHNNIISAYDIIKERWESHIHLDAPVKSIYRMVMNSKDGIFKLGIILRNDTIRTYEGVKDKNRDFICKLTDEIIYLPGSMHANCADTRASTWKCMFILCDKNGESKFDLKTCK
jgi:hypothetical protein